MKIREITQIALVTAVIIALGMIPPIPLGFIPVPIVLQNLGIMIAGIVLGPKRGTVSVALFLFLALIGFPVLKVVDRQVRRSLWGRQGDIWSVGC